MGAEFFAFMDDKGIEIEVVNTAQDYRRVLLWFHLKKLLIIGVFYLVVTAPMLWLTFFGAGANPFDEKNNSVIHVMIIFALIPILIIGGIFYNIWKQARNIEKTLEPAKFIFSNEGLESTSKSTSVKVTWDTFQKFQELKEDFLFYPQKNIFYTIPKRFFQDDFQREKFKNLVREKLGDKAKMKI